jgi:hypothetical protein
MNVNNFNGAVPKKNNKFITTFCSSFASIATPAFPSSLQPWYNHSITFRIIEMKADISYK